MTLGADKFCLTKNLNNLQFYKMLSIKFRPADQFHPGL